MYGTASTRVSFVVILTSPRSLVQPVGSPTAAPMMNPTSGRRITTVNSDSSASAPL